VLAIMLGRIWAANLLFLVVPSAGCRGSFAVLAASHGDTSLVGPGGTGSRELRRREFDIVRRLIAVPTACLAVALLPGVMTRLASVLGFVASLVFLATHRTATFAFPGGTDVGPHRLCRATYVALYVAGAGRCWSLDGRIRRTGRARIDGLSNRIATLLPRD
jgi:hypothetical protein